MRRGKSQATALLSPWLSPGPLATSTRPSGLGKCFASGVTVVPEQPELFCQHSAFTSQVLGRDRGRGAGSGGPMWPQ